MRNGLAKIVALVVGLLLLSVPLAAHHGASAFDSTKRVTMKGTVVEWFWANPHCILRFDVSNDKGDVEHWVAEGSNPADMVNGGWAKLSFAPEWSKVRQRIWYIASLRWFARRDSRWANR